jgi:hypothetical protein
MPLVDSYTLRARAWPLLLVASPLFALAIAAAHLELGPAIGSAALGTAVVFLGSQFARDAGKKLEPELWGFWGGAPTLRRLTFDGSTSESQVHRTHQAVGRATNQQLPTEEMEAQDPAAAKEAYEHAIFRLRELTRDRTRFGLLFKENVNYGFRRSLLGLKPLGVIVAGATLMAGMVIVIFADGATSARATSAGVPGAWSLLALLVYWRLINRGWVRIVAEAYADRLLGCAEVIADESQA